MFLRDMTLFPGQRQYSFYFLTQCLTLSAFQQISVIRERPWNWSVWAGSYTPKPTLASTDPSKHVFLVAIASFHAWPAPRSLSPLSLVISSSHQSLVEPKFHGSRRPTPVSPGVSTLLFLCSTVRGISPQPSKHSQEVY